MSNKFICEFIETYESHNLQGYNSGGYAYLSSQFNAQNGSSRHGSVAVQQQQVNALSS